MSSPDKLAERLLQITDKGDVSDVAEVLGKIDRRGPNQKDLPSLGYAKEWAEEEGYLGLSRYAEDIACENTVSTYKQAGENFLKGLLVGYLGWSVVSGLNGDPEFFDNSNLVVGYLTGGMNGLLNFKRTNRLDSIEDALNYGDADRDFYMTDENVEKVKERLSEEYEFSFYE